MWRAKFFAHTNSVYKFNIDCATLMGYVELIESQCHLIRVLILIASSLLRFEAATAKLQCVMVKAPYWHPPSFSVPTPQILNAHSRM